MPGLERTAAAAELDWQGLSLMATWRIEIVRAKLERLGTVEAANAGEAIRKEMTELNIPETVRRRAGLLGGAPT